MPTMSNGAVEITNSGLKLVARARPGSERDLLTGHETDRLSIKSLTGRVLLEVAPRERWTHERLLAVANGEEVTQIVKAAGGADVYVGQAWIGSTEV